MIYPPIVWFGLGALTSGLVSILLTLIRARNTKNNMLLQIAKDITDRTQGIEDTFQSLDISKSIQRIEVFSEIYNNLKRRC